MRTAEMKWEREKAEIKAAEVASSKIGRDIQSKERDKLAFKQILHCKNCLVKLTNHWLPQFHLLFCLFIYIEKKKGVGRF